MAGSITNSPPPPYVSAPAEASSSRQAGTSASASRLQHQLGSQAEAPVRIRRSSQLSQFATYSWGFVKGASVGAVTIGSLGASLGAVFGAGINAAAKYPVDDLTGKTALISALVCGIPFGIIHGSTKGAQELREKLRNRAESDLEAGVPSQEMGVRSEAVPVTASTGHDEAEAAERSKSVSEQKKDFSATLEKEATPSASQAVARPEPAHLDPTRQEGMRRDALELALRQAPAVPDAPPAYSAQSTRTSEEQEKTPMPAQ